MKFLYWSFIGAVLGLPYIFADKLTGFNPWGWNLAKQVDYHYWGTPGSFVGENFGTIVAVVISAFVFFLYAFHSDTPAAKALVIAAVFFTVLNWFSVYVIGLFALLCTWTFFRDGTALTIASVDWVNERIEIGRLQRELEMPRFDGNGMIIAYRYILQDDKGFMSCTANGLRRNGTKWSNGGFLEAHELPTWDNTSGIYACKSPNDPELELYRGSGARLVKVKMWGRVIEHATGYRAQYCQIEKFLTKQGE